MKHLFTLLAGLILLLSCQKTLTPLEGALSELDKDCALSSLTSVSLNPLTYTGPEGALSIDQINALKNSETQDCGFVSVWAKPGIALMFNYNVLNLKRGKELSVTDLTFGKMYSSNSEEYTGSFSGKMILKDINKKCIVITMNKVQFNIASGTFQMDGDLVCPFNAILYGE
jgi:hypothetical protein